MTRGVKGGLIQDRYLEPYLDAAAKERCTVATFIGRKANGSAIGRSIASHCKTRLLRALFQRIERSEVARIRSKMGRVAFVRVSDAEQDPELQQAVNEYLLDPIHEKQTQQAVEQA